MMKYIPASKTSSILYEGVEVHVSSDFDYVTVDSDGEVSGWECVEEPTLVKGYYVHRRANHQGYLQTYVKKWIGTFESDEKQTFEPQLFKL